MFDTTNPDNWLLWGMTACALGLVGYLVSLSIDNMRTERRRRKRRERRRAKAQVAAAEQSEVVPEVAHQVQK